MAFIDELEHQTTGAILRPGKYTWRGRTYSSDDNSITILGTVLKDGNDWIQRLRITKYSYEMFWKEHFREVFGENKNMKAILTALANPDKTFDCWVVDNQGHLNVQFLMHNEEDL